MTIMTIIIAVKSYTLQFTVAFLLQVFLYQLPCSLAIPALNSLKVMFLMAPGLLPFRNINVNIIQSRHTVNCFGPGYFRHTFGEIISTIIHKIFGTNSSFHVK